MRIYMMAQSKGGSGKSVTLIALASAAIAKGERVLVVDTDQVADDGTAGTLTNWAQMAREMDFWHENMDIVTASSVEDIFDKMEEFEDTKDLCLIDTRGGIDAATVALASVAHLIVIPSMPDLDELRRGAMMKNTLEKAGESITEEGVTIAPIVGVYNRVASLSKQSSESEAREATASFGITFASSELRDRKAYRNMRDSGLLSVIMDFLNEEGGLNKGQARHFNQALEESIGLLSELDKNARTDK